MLCSIHLYVGLFETSYERPGLGVSVCEKYVRCIISVNVDIKCIICVNKMYNSIDILYRS